MTTQIIEAKKGKITPEMFAVAEKEGFTKQEIIDKVASGRVVILKNNRRQNVIPTAVVGNNGQNKCEYWNLT